MQSSTAILASALAAGATLIGFACGSATRPRAGGTLPAAGSAGEGGGLLARASAGGSALFGRTYGGHGYGGPMYGGALYGDQYWDEYGGDLYGDAALYADIGGFAYGGLAYGGALYGGTLYGNYYFDPGLLRGRARSAPSPYSKGYYAVTIADGGAIEGRVTWPRPPRSPQSLAVTGDDRGCDDSIPNESVITDEKGNLANAVVYLEDIQRGRSGVVGANTGYSYHYYGDRSAGARLQVGGVVETRHCRFYPHVQLVAPVGAVLKLSNGDAAGRTVRARRWSDTSRDLVFTRTLRDQGKVHAVRLDRHGFVELRSLEEGETANAWVVVPRHPYYAITDERGRFRLDAVPAGTYKLAVWHEPVVLGVDSGGRLRVSEPVVKRVKVRVKAGQATKVKVRLDQLR